MNQELTQIRRSTLAEQVEDALRVDIVMGVLKPGERLRAQELARRYGVSATPFREALQRLAGERLVEIDPRLGASVAVVSADELRDIYDARLILETQALYRSVERLDAAGMADLERRMTALRDATIASRAEGVDRADVGWPTLHREFHHALVEHCDSAWLMRFVTTLYDHADRYQTLSRQMIERDPGRDTLVEHTQLYEAAIRLDPAAAVSQLRDHLKLTRDALSERIEPAALGSGAQDEPVNA